MLHGRSSHAWRGHVWSYNGPSTFCCSQTRVVCIFVYNMVYAPHTRCRDTYVTHVQGVACPDGKYGADGTNECHMEDCAAGTFAAKADGDFTSTSSLATQCESYGAGTATQVCGELQNGVSAYLMRVYSKRHRGPCSCSHVPPHAHALSYLPTCFTCFMGALHMRGADMCGPIMGRPHSVAHKHVWCVYLCTTWYMPLTHAAATHMLHMYKVWPVPLVNTDRAERWIARLAQRTP